MRASECGAFKCFPWHNACAKCFFSLSLRISYLYLQNTFGHPSQHSADSFFQTGHAGYSYSRWEGIFYEFWIWKASTGGFILQTKARFKDGTVQCSAIRAERVGVVGECVAFVA